MADVVVVDPSPVPSITIEEHPEWGDLFARDPRHGAHLAEPT